MYIKLIKVNSILPTITFIIIFYIGTYFKIKIVLNNKQFTLLKYYDCMWHHNDIILLLIVNICR